MFYNFHTDSSCAFIGAEHNTSDHNLGSHFHADELSSEITENFFS